MILLEVDGVKIRWGSLELVYNSEPHSFESFTALPKPIMNAAKRRRDKITAVTPTVNQNNDSCASSFVQSSPLRRLERTNYSQQRSTLGVGLHFPSKHTGTSVPPCDIRPTYRHYRFPSLAVSGVDVPQGNENEGEQEEDNDSDEVIMCVDMRERGTVGCCYYESSTGSLYLFEDIQCGGLDVIGNCEYTLTNYMCMN